MPRQQHPVVTLAFSAPQWRRRGPFWRQHITDLAALVLSAAGIDRARHKHLEISVTLADDATIREVNRTHRAKDKPTNVLSFPSFATLGMMQSTLARPLPKGMTIPIGDLIFGFETIQAEAVNGHKSFDAHMTHLIIHGLLHLLGYDHQRDDEAAVMEGLETKLMLGLGLTDPYAVF
jgi:probable rRNA maturation factor